MAQYCTFFIFFFYIDLSQNVFTIRYEDPQKGTCPAIPSDGIPFTIMGRKILECHQGKDRKKKSKERATVQRNSKVSTLCTLYILILNL